MKEAIIWGVEVLYPVTAQLTIVIRRDCSTVIEIDTRDSTT